MSRIADMPITLPKGVEVKIENQLLTAKGGNGTESLNVHPKVSIAMDDGFIKVTAVDSSKEAKALSGTMRSLANNLIVGISQGFEKKLQLIGVGYRAKASGNNVDLTLGFSHPVVYSLPKGVSAETPTPTEIVLKSHNKQLLGQVAAEIRSFRKPEPYKGKGIRYSDERVRTKEAKKSSK